MDTLLSSFGSSIITRAIDVSVVTLRFSTVEDIHLANEGSMNLQVRIWVACLSKSERIDLDKLWGHFPGNPLNFTKHIQRKNGETY